MIKIIIYYLLIYKVVSKRKILNEIDTSISIIFIEHLISLEITLSNFFN
jgi:hypothetical protein